MHNFIAICSSLTPSFAHDKIPLSMSKIAAHFAFLKIYVTFIVFKAAAVAAGVERERNEEAGGWLYHYLTHTQKRMWQGESSVECIQKLI